MTIRRDELFSYRVDEPLPPWVITVLCPGDQQTQPGAPEPPLFLPPSLHLIHPLPFLVPPFPIYLAPKSPDQLTNAQTKTPAPVLHCQHSCLKRGGQNPELEDQAKTFPTGGTTCLNTEISPTFLWQQAECEGEGVSSKEPGFGLSLKH